MGIAQSALILLGIGIVSSRFKAGTGLQELGTGIQTLVAAPLVGTGTGLSTFSGGLRDLAETLGDLGRGFSTLFKSIPNIPGFGPGEGAGGGGGGVRPAILPIIGNGSSIFPAPKLLITNLTSDLDTGGGSRVPSVAPAPPPPLVIQPSYVLPPTPQPIAVRPTNPNFVML